MMRVYPYPPLITLVIKATSICIATNIPYDVHSGSQAGASPKVAGGSLKPSSHNRRRGEPVLAPSV